jgi:hypothetical protein
MDRGQPVTRPGPVSRTYLDAITDGHGERLNLDVQVSHYPGGTPIPQLSLWSEQQKAPAGRLILGLAGIQGIRDFAKRRPAQGTKGCRVIALSHGANGQDLFAMKRNLHAHRGAIRSGRR